MSADKEKEKERPKDNNNERKPNESRPRPTLDIYSFNLIHLWNVSNSLNWMQLRKTISERIGKVKFIETFEAWTYKKIGHIVIEFEESKGLNAFVEAVKNDNFLEAGVEWEQIKNRRAFFQRILKSTGVDLFNCKAVPPNFRWRQNQGRQRPPVSTQDDDYSSRAAGFSDGRRMQRGNPYIREDGGGRGFQQSSFGPVSVDSDLKSKPFGTFMPNQNQAPMGYNTAMMNNMNGYGGYGMSSRPFFF